MLLVYYYSGILLVHMDARKLVQHKTPAMQSLQITTKLFSTLLHLWNAAKPSSEPFALNDLALRAELHIDSGLEPA